MKEEYFNKLLKVLKKCEKNDDVPVSAIIVKDEKIISVGYNSRVKKSLTINHAEIMAISKANKKLKNYFLYDCDMYVTLKPCEMCEKVINNARIRNVYYLLDKPSFKNEYNKTNYKKVDYPQSEKCHEILRNFFNKIR